MDDRLVTIRRFSQPWEADLARATLEAKGIPAFVVDAHTVSMNWLWSNAIGGVRLQVPESHVKAASEMLSSEIDSSSVAQQEEVDTITCPNCGKRNSTIIRYGRKWAFLSWLLAGFPLFFPPKRYKCLECGKVWKPEKNVIIDSS